MIFKFTFLKSQHKKYELYSIYSLIYSPFKNIASAQLLYNVFCQNYWKPNEIDEKQIWVVIVKRLIQSNKKICLLGSDV